MTLSSVLGSSLTFCFTSGSRCFISSTEELLLNVASGGLSGFSAFLPLLFPELVTGWDFWVSAAVELPECFVSSIPRL